MSTYSTNLKIELIGTGEQQGTWGVTTDSNFSNVFEQALVGRVTVPFTDADVTLTATNSVSSQSFRNLYLNCTGTNTGIKNLIVPTINKNYVVQNNTTGGYSIVVKTSSGTGITVPTGKTCIVYTDGTNVIQAFDYLPVATVGTLAITSVTANSITAGSITDSGLTAGRLTYAGTAGLLQDDADLTFDGTTLTAAKVSSTQVDITAQGDLRLQDSTGGQYVAFQAPATVPASYTLIWPDTDGTNNQALVTDGSGVLSWSSAASGDVYGPASSTDSAIACFDGTTGKAIKNTVVTIADSTGNVSGVETLNISGFAGNSATGALQLPVGTTAQQPTGAIGKLRFNSTTSEFEGYTGSAWSSVGGSALSNDTTTATNLYPLFATATTGTALNVYTSNAKYLYKPSTGDLQSSQLIANNGLVLNNATVSASYTIATGNNAMSVGPMTVASGQTVTVSTGQRWVIL